MKEGEIQNEKLQSQIKELTNSLKFSMESLQLKIKTDLEKKINEISESKKKVEGDLEKVHLDIKAKDSENQNLVK